MTTDTKFDEIALEIRRQCEREIDTHKSVVIDRRPCVVEIDDAERLLMVDALVARRIRDELQKDAVPVAWKDTMHTSHPNGDEEHEPLLLGYEGWEKLPDGTDLFTHANLPPQERKELERLREEARALTEGSEFGLPPESYTEVGKRNWLIGSYKAELFQLRAELAALKNK